MDTPWALMLETMVLKKSSNKAVFRKILYWSVMMKV
jgi:hypothetical protein